MSRSSLTRPLACILALPLLLGGASDATTSDNEPTVRNASHPCFIEPARWNVALDGPLPRCGRP